MAVSLRVLGQGAGRSSSVLRSASLHRRRARWLRPDVLLCVALYTAALTVWWTGTGVVFEGDAVVGDLPSAVDSRGELPAANVGDAETPAHTSTSGASGDGGLVSEGQRRMAEHEEAGSVQEVAIGSDGAAFTPDGSGDSVASDDAEPSADGSSEADPVNATTDSETDDGEADAEEPDLPLTWSDVGLYLVPAVATLQALMYLATFWSVDVDCFFAYTKVRRGGTQHGTCARVGLRRHACAIAHPCECVSGRVPALPSGWQRCSRDPRQGRA